MGVGLVVGDLQPGVMSVYYDPQGELVGVPYYIRKYRLKLLHVTLQSNSTRLPLI